MPACAEMTTNPLPNLSNLPVDIYDEISAFLSTDDLICLLRAAKTITVSAYIMRDRKHSVWERRSGFVLACRGDLPGLQYLASIGRISCYDHAMCGAARYGHLHAVKFFHSIGVIASKAAVAWAAEIGHLAIVQYLHSIGAPCESSALHWAANEGHLAVVEFLYSVGATCTEQTLIRASLNGHKKVVEFLKTHYTFEYKNYLKY